MSNNELVIIATLLPVALIVTVIVIVVMFIRKKNRLLIERQEAEIRYLSEINKAKIEVKDAVLGQVAGELHDNIGQMIALNVMYVKSLQKKFDVEKLNALQELSEGTLNEVRQLAKLLNQDLIQRYNLVEALRLLVSYISKLNAIKLVLNINGIYKALDSNIELVIFRMCQEFISNSLKHADCDTIIIDVNYTPEMMLIMVEDNGKGFNLDDISGGTGLNTIKKRAQIINASIDIVSALDKGTSLLISYKF